MTASILLTSLAVTATAGFSTALDELREAQAVPGVAVAVTIEGNTAFVGASGLADIENGRKMSADTVLYAGSLSKIITAVAAMKLAGDNRLAFDDCVPGIATLEDAESCRVRVEHLLTHTSGLPREGNFGYWFTADFPTATELAAFLAETDLDAVPGEAASYSNIGFAALGPVIEQASGLGYADAVRHLVFAPLAMEDSGADGAPTGVASGYSPQDRVLPNSRTPFAGLGRAVGRRYIREYHEARAMTPAFGAYSTARDLGRLARMLLGFAGESVLSLQSRRQMFTDRGNGRGIGLRLGQYKGRRVARHGGWFAAHRSYLLLDLDAGIGIAVMANGDSADPERIAETMLDIARRSRKE